MAYMESFILWVVFDEVEVVLFQAGYRNSGMDQSFSKMLRRLCIHDTIPLSEAFSAFEVLQ